jgi:hypothetical protein
MELMGKYLSAIPEDYYDKLESVFLGVLDHVSIPVSEIAEWDKKREADKSKFDF